MPYKPKPRRRRTALFTRALLPPERYHSTRKGKRGYSRAVTRREEREARQEM